MPNKDRSDDVADIKKEIDKFKRDFNRISEEQAEDDAIRKTSIPLEYEDIIKKIHSDKE